MGVVNIKDAEANLSGLVDRVNEGEEILIARSGRPVAKLVRVENAPRKPGYLKGQIHIAEDFDEPLPEEIAKGFRGVESRVVPWSPFRLFPWRIEAEREQSRIRPVAVESGTVFDLGAELEQ